ncbi:DUF3047 domain-containing protein [Siccirubricoccus sp. KC 17139]|uniref:DUF3047 domain-containing protein n=1 Tax=Siccirubricoccus soli TaxID=2899147 RepID=A0ABT1D4T1_9PROT|nr:DUF3047 domain-containing protein [Siccirubricoccus soli]MCO6416923.1 DUF3047 domain-containing protein [Siccirubricoccus soli]MCP2683058.1 DUF3047 domain-containing protein [Siccirubricoccus soli]
MRQLATSLAVTIAAGLLTGAGSVHLPTALEEAGWRHAEWHGLPPARFRPLPEGGVLVEGQGQGSFIWRPVQGPAQCLSWRWRVDHGPPPTDLTRRGGDDRALSLGIGFAGWPPQATLWQRSQHAVAQAAAGSHPLPRSVVLFVWGGTGREPRPFPSPYMAGLGKAWVLRPADAPRGRWFEERVDLAAAWRASFGGEPPPLQELVIGTDAEDTASRLEARVEAIRFGPCR